MSKSNNLCVGLENEGERKHGSTACSKSHIHLRSFFYIQPLIRLAITSQCDVFRLTVVIDNQTGNFFNLLDFFPFSIMAKRIIFHLRWGFNLIYNSENVWLKIGHGQTLRSTFLRYSSHFWCSQEKTASSVQHSKRRKNPVEDFRSLIQLYNLCLCDQLNRNILTSQYGTGLIYPWQIVFSNKQTVVIVTVGESHSLF